MTEPATTSNTTERFTPDEVIARQRNRQLFIMMVVIIALSGLVWLASNADDDDSPIAEVMLVGGSREDPAIKKAEISRLQIWKGAEAEPFELIRDGDQWVVPSRFYAPVDEREIASVIDGVLSATRVNRASTTDTLQYAIYGLNDEDALHVRLLDGKGEDLLHFLIGRAEGGSREFVRMIGPAQPDGIFELGGLGGSMGTLYSSLNLDGNGEPQPRRWISTQAFDPLPDGCEAQEITIRDGDRELTFARKRDSTPDTQEWLLTAPRAGEAEGATLRSIIDTLKTYNATDIAGRDTDARKLGVAAPEKEVTLKYTQDGNLRTVRLYFGNRNDEGEVAVWLKSTDQGGYIWWASEFALGRIFRATPDLMRKLRINLIPDGITADTLTVEDAGQTLRLARDSADLAAGWKIELPWQQEADRVQVANLLTGLSTLQGYPVSGSIDKQALGLGTGISTRVITAVYPDAKPEDRDGDDTEDPPPETTQPEPPKPDEPAKPPLKVATLFFGKMQQGEVPVMRVLDGVEAVYWVTADAANRLFAEPTRYIKLAELKLLNPSQKPGDLLVQNAEATLQLTYTGAEGPKLWKIVQPWDEMADQAEADAIARAISDLRAIKLTEPLDKAVYKLGAGVSTRWLQLTVGSDADGKTTRVYFGEKRDGLTTVLIIRPDAAEEFWLIRGQDLFALFVSPADFRVLGTFSGKVRHILISWKDHPSGVALRDPERTEEQARALAQDILTRARAGESFVELQKKYNEDSDPTAVYDVDPTARWVKPFLRLSSQLGKDEVGLVESQFGLHVMKRIE